jgi:hypothetical protein
MRDRACPAHLDPEKWEYSLQVVDESIRQMHRSLENPTFHPIPLKISPMQPPDGVRGGPHTLIARGAA